MAEWEQLVTLAVEQHVAPLLHHRLKMHGCQAMMPAAVQKTLQKKYYANTLRNMHLYGEFSRLTHRLHEQKIAAIALKGVQLAATVYESIVLREMVDIDILVHPVDLSAVIQQVQELGYQPLVPLLDPDAYASYRHHLPPFIHPTTVARIEIHWTLTRPGRVHTIMLNDLWSECRAFKYPNGVAQGFCIEDLLLHVCMHATYHHWLQQGVRFLCDVAEIIWRYTEELKWDLVVARANSWEWQRGVFLALSAAQQLLGVQIPDWVWERLNPDGREQFATDELLRLLFPEHRRLFNSPTGHFLNFLNTPSLSTKLRLASQRLFLSRKEMAIKYAIEANSPWIYPYYAVRLKDLVADYTRKTWRMEVGDPAMLAVSQQQAKLQRWLEQS